MLMIGNKLYLILDINSGRYYDGLQRKLVTEKYLYSNSQEVESHLLMIPDPVTKVTNFKIIPCELKEDK